MHPLRCLNVPYSSGIFIALPRVSRAAAIEQPAMVDRFNRLFLRTLRALRDLRRYAPTVMVQHAAQVNIGGQQVNVAGGGETC